MNRDSQNDEKLIAATLDGDSGAFGELVRRYQDRLFNTMIHVTGSKEEAEDVAQDAFIQAYVKLSTFSGKSAFYTWLYRVAFNIAISRSRKKRPRVSLEQVQDASGAEPSDESETATETMERLERADQVHIALQKLTDEHRAILVLREMEGCCYDTIASMLDLPVGTVRSRLHRARSQMREYLKELLQLPSTEP